MLKTLKKTNLERYGVEHYFNNKKGMKTKIEKYGNINNVEKGIKTNRENGTYEKNHIKAKQTSLEKYGDATYRNSNKCKETKLEKYGNENYNNAQNAQVKKRQTMEQSGQWIPLDQMSDWELYKREVRKLTEQNYDIHKEIINPNNYNRVLCGQDGYQLDHIISVYEGFQRGLSIDYISSEHNLQMLTPDENRTKWHI
jgi:hypothetical protein